MDRAINVSGSIDTQCNCTCKGSYFGVNCRSCPGQLDESTVAGCTEGQCAPGHTNASETGTCTLTTPTGSYFRKLSGSTNFSIQRSFDDHTIISGPISTYVSNGSHSAGMYVCADMINNLPAFDEMTARFWCYSLGFPSSQALWYPAPLPNNVFQGNMTNVNSVFVDGHVKMVQYRQLRCTNFGPGLSLTTCPTMVNAVLPLNPPCTKVVAVSCVMSTLRSRSPYVGTTSKGSAVGFVYTIHVDPSTTPQAKYHSVKYPGSTSEGRICAAPNANLITIGTVFCNSLPGDGTVPATGVLKDNSTAFAVAPSMRIDNCTGTEFTLDSCEFTYNGCPIGEYISAFGC